MLENCIKILNITDKQLKRLTLYSIQQQSKKIMPQFQIHLRHENGKLQTLTLSPSTSFEELKRMIGKNLNIQYNSFQIYFRGQLLCCKNNINPVWNAGITQNSIIDVGSKLDLEKQLNLQVQYGINRVHININKSESVNSVKQKIGATFDCDPEQFDIVIRDQFIQNGQRTLDSYGVKNNQLVLVKRKIFYNSLVGGLGNKLKVVESVASGSDNKDQLQNQQKDVIDAVKDSQKKINCSSSMRIIKDKKQRQKNNMKHSSIQPYTMHKNQIDEIEQRQTKRVKIQDIKQTMSFGSLEELKSQQTQVDVYNEQKSMYYRFKCPFGSKVANIKNILAKAERKHKDKLQILDTKDNDQIQQLCYNGESICLIYRVII